LTNEAINDIRDGNKMSLIRSHIVFLNDNYNPFKSKDNRVAQTFFKVKLFVILLTSLR
jgi:hypothetical protein